MPAKKTTIDDLARMVASGFDNVENRLDKVEEKLDNIEKLILRQHSDKIKNLERRMQKMEEMFAIK